MATKKKIKVVVGGWDFDTAEDRPDIIEEEKPKSEYRFTLKVEDEEDREVIEERAIERIRAITGYCIADCEVTIF